MKINTVELTNFKFHKSLKFDIKNKNCLIYGENGTGKSSIYWALYSVFKKDMIDVEKYKTYESTGLLNVKISLDNNDTFERRNTANDVTNIDDNTKTIYFAHQDFLEDIIIKDNFYEVLENSLNNFFPLLHNHAKELNAIKSNLDLPIEDKIRDTKNLIEKFESFLKDLEDEAKKIINDCFDEIFSIKFTYYWSGISATGMDYIFSEPKINITMNGKDNLKQNFNEAKIKLASLSIFFALIKLKEDAEDTDSQFKLLVLDDFLTSLDMANRKLIIKYIVDNFSDYQKIILTHNIQFHNLIIKFLKSREEDNDWDIKNIYLSENDTIALINNRENSYLKKSKEELLSGEYYSSGNYARKEFERIINDFKQILEIGKQEQLKYLLDTLKSTSSDKKVFKKPILVLNKLVDRYTNISNIISNEDENIVKIGKINTEVNQINVLLEQYRCELYDLQNLLSKVEFYKDIIFNPASHNNDEIEIYRKECVNSIKLLEELDKILKSLK